MRDREKGMAASADGLLKNLQRKRLTGMYVTLFAFSACFVTKKKSRPKEITNQ